ncbi:DNA topoisomerase IV, alpha subunit [Dendrothele bispora CBS 962.96]|uniref:DNA topoisomerase (ATP-hydrolyzing) n=1 Tax=Dendrothele bispora (strain CBS 962.96) TaxID=1314807 RepID=A0A4S8MQ24_DENBC|nr:DNA topoisomerase IV, alpha subunit [Dendrothele bispora CBS 962.96]
MLNRIYGVKYLTYPRKMASGSAKPIAQLFRVMNFMHEAICNHIPATKRHLHAQILLKDVPLFKSQKVVDNLVDDIAATLAVERSELNVRATSKGTFCGSGLTIHLFTGESIQGKDVEATLIPVGEDIESFDFDQQVKWVLIVEKDAVFQTLCHLKLTNHPDLYSKGLLITGKGYPDLATRHLVKTLSDCLPPSIPILALVDSDPYGIDILSVYKFGSRALLHERDRLAAVRVQWLGIWSSELALYGIERDDLIPITEHDQKKAFAMLQRPQLPTKWRKELMHMLHNRRKAEIEILCSRNRLLSLSQAQDSFQDPDACSFNPASQTLEDVDIDVSQNQIPSNPLLGSQSPLLQYLFNKLPQFIAAAQVS